MQMIGWHFRQWKSCIILYNTAVQYNADVVEYRYKAVTDHTETGEQIEQGNGSYLKDLSDDKMKRKILMASTENFSFGCMRKLYRMSLIKEHDIFVDAVLYFYLQAPDSTVHRNWDAHKLDNAGVWLLLMEDLKKRGVFADYEKELECMFYDWGFGMSISMMLRKGYLLNAEEITLLREMLLRLFPDVLKNPYIVEKEDEWDIILKRILEQKTELTQDDMKGFHHKLIGALQ